MFLGIGHDPNARMFRGLIDLDDDGYIRTTDQVFIPACPVCSPVAMCRIAGTGRRLPLPAPAARPPSKWRNTLKNTAIEEPVTEVLKENFDRIEAQIAAACREAGRPRGEVALMAVSKMHPASAIVAAEALGIRLFGENRVQEFQEKRAQLSLPGAEFHLIGHLQSNKAARAAELFASIDTLDSVSLAERLNQAATRLGRRLAVLIEIKLSPEESKAGSSRTRSSFSSCSNICPACRVGVSRAHDGAAIS